MIGAATSVTVKMVTTMAIGAATSGTMTTTIAATEMTMVMTATAEMTTAAMGTTERTVDQSGD
jgi:hypothetical protein